MLLNIKMCGNISFNVIIIFLYQRISHWLENIYEINEEKSLKLTKLMRKTLNIYIWLNDLNRLITIQFWCCCHFIYIKCVIYEWTVYTNCFHGYLFMLYIYYVFIEYSLFTTKRHTEYMNVDSIRYNNCI